MEPHAEAEPSTFEKRPVVDLFLVCDTTGSMGSYVASLSSTINQVFALTELLFNGRLKLHVVSYKDYCDDAAVLTSVGQRTHSNDEIKTFVAKLRPSGGGDYPEAVKTALNAVVATINAVQATDAVVFLYTDAPPHHPATTSAYLKQEVAAIAGNPAYTAGSDWFGIQKTLQSKRVPVYTFHSNHYTPEATMSSAVFYALLGPVTVLTSRTPTMITKSTIGLLLQLMGQDFACADELRVTNISRTGVHLDPTFTAEKETQLGSIHGLTSSTQPFSFESHASMVEDLGQLPVLFKSNEAFRNLVYATFTEVFTPENVLSLTYNPVLGKLWRLVCGRRLDERLQTLSTQLSTCIPALSETDKRQVQEWLDASHDNSDFIHDTLRALPSGASYVLEAAAFSIDKDDVRSLARAPNPGVLAAVQSLLTHLRIYPSVETAMDEASIMHLPETISNEHLFSFLPHLILPGTTFSTKGAAVMALLCCLSENALLAQRAEAYLTSIRGRWIPLDNVVDFPEVLSLEFIKLLYRGRAYLTEKEARIYTQLYHVHRLRLAATKDVDVTLGFSPTKTQLWPDTKVRCASCGVDTSCSLMVTPDMCALCFTSGVEEAKAIQAKAAVPGANSHLVECRGCHGLYAVVQTDLLNITPKCFYCRTGAKHKPAMYHCNGCWNDFVDPAGLYAAVHPNACAVCTATPAKATAPTTLTLQALLTANPGILADLQWTRPTTAASFAAMAFDRTINYFKMFTLKHDLLFSAKEATNQALTTQVIVDGKRVHNADALVASIRDTVVSGTLKDVCNLCFDELTLPALTSACGRCNTKCCEPCLSRWYGAVQPGKMVLASTLGCPFCRRQPTLGVLRKHNRQACALVASKMTWRADMYYGWCLGCYKVKELIERTCAVEPPYDVATFRCTECVAAATARAATTGTVTPVTVACPGCSVETEKTGGCNHITCNCGQHWCYVCAAGFDSADDVYEHLYATHRGIYDFDDE
ncbi:hypothetical protein SDRG_15920 [Saprolegnia diclina VS20]|uniref:RING-type domain-containing protein n=1 Tax=Saprolegnia diclina (strain VS20) TaxID=1156394 RepID=T0PLJ2_SAPDV|nr:hypothetical protein SDRG_15920 [Saprolegnia diclina VS20]EQC26259.1 hypothetical protein SDRG_15920 [Saprolegnia diclina VS20]|eukprot:XP_008620328.1 hypothetical protein SDRG_15920 [Saprolegnia diclina VS20]